MSNTSVPEIPYQFADPCPTSMRDVNITDLSSVNINWKMLTLARPKTKTDEEIFSKSELIFLKFTRKITIIMNIALVLCILQQNYKMHKIPIIAKNNSKVFFYIQYSIQVPKVVTYVGASNENAHQA